jgi:ribosome-binding protein aMBF1 (putative translation factor)
MGKSVIALLHDGTHSPWTHLPQPPRFLYMPKRDVLKSFGDRVREVRLQKGLSQEDLARLAKIDRSYIGGIERGQRNAGVRNVWRIADALGVSAADLFMEESGDVRD